MGIVNKENALLMATGIDNSGLKKDLQNMEKEIDAFSQKMQSKEIKGILDNMLGDFNQNIQGLARIQKELREITAQRATINKNEKAGIMSTKESIQQRSRLLAREVELKNARKELTAALNTEMKAMQATDGSIEKVALSLTQLTAAYDKLNSKERNGSVGASLASQISKAETELLRLNAAMRATIVETDNLNQKVTTSTSSKRGGFNSLGYSVQQVARELPSLTMGVSTFFLAISNNLPILGDELHKAKVEYESLKASGQKGVPVWKQVASSIMSWQTAMILGVTILSMHGKKIIAWSKSLFKGKEAMKSTIEMQEEINRSIGKSASGFGDAVTKIRGLQNEWVALGDSMEKKKQFIEDNQTEFSELGIAVNTVKDAENLLIDNTDAFIEALKLRAQASAAQKLASEAYEKQLQAERMVELEVVKGPSTWQKIKAGMIQGMMSGERANVLEDNSPTAEDFHKDRLKSLKEEADQAKATGDAYFDLQRKREQEANDILQQAGLSTKVNTPSQKGTIDLEKKLSRELLKLQSDNIDASISLMEEGNEKRFAEIHRAYDKAIAALQEKEAEWRAAQGGKLTIEQTAELDKGHENAYKELQKQEEKQREDWLKAEKDSWNEYYREYGTYEEKRLAITEHYAALIGKAQTDGEKAILGKQQEAALNELDNSMMKQSDLWKNLFADASKMSRKRLQEVITDAKQLVDYINGVEGATRPVGFKEEDIERIRKSPKEFAEIYDKLIEKQNEFEKNTQYPFSGLINGFEKLKESAKTYEKALGDVSEEEKKRLENEAAMQRATGMKFLRDGAIEAADGVSSLADVMQELADVTGDARLARMGEELKSAGNILSKTAEGSKAGPWGALIGAAVGTLESIKTGVFADMAKQRAWQNETEKFQQRYNRLLAERNYLEEAFSSVFGTDNLARAEAAYDTYQKALKDYNDALNKTLEGDTSNGSLQKDFLNPLGIATDSMDSFVDNYLPGWVGKVGDTVAKVLGKTNPILGWLGIGGEKTNKGSVLKDAMWKFHRK